MAGDKGRFWKSVAIVILLVGILWLIHYLQYFGLYDFSAFANMPRSISGLKGIIFSPFIHGQGDAAISEHLVSNTLPVMVLLFVLINAYPKVALPVYLFVHFVSGFLVWLLAPAYTLHIGISGVIYGLAFFLIMSGLFRKNRAAITIAILVTLVYGGMLAGFLPKQGVSWQSHLYGAISGIIIAFIVRRIDLPPPHEFELEEKEEDRHFFDEERPHSGGNH